MVVNFEKGIDFKKIIIKGMIIPTSTSWSHNLFESVSLSLSKTNSIYKTLILNIIKRNAFQKYFEIINWKLIPIYFFGFIKITSLSYC
jgi:hypothetical protein